MSIRSVIVGYGNAGHIHERQYPSEVKVVGIVDIDPKKLEEPKQKSIPTFDSIERAVGSIQPDIWDICVPTEAHFSIARFLLESLHEPRILVEKPVCTPKETEEFISLVRNYPHARITVNENYLSSEVTQKAMELVQKHGIYLPDISIEFSKNRIRDILEGRFIDKELKVLGYEGPHMLTCVSGITDRSFPQRLVSARLEDMELPDGRVLEKQGLGEMTYLTDYGLRVYFFTSMEGRIGVPVKEFDPPKSIPIEDRETRYRVMRIRKDGFEILCQYEPIPGFKRSIGRVYVKATGRVVERWQVSDNSMRSHLTKTIAYLTSETENPSPVETAITFVNILYEAVRLSR